MSVEILMLAAAVTGVTGTFDCTIDQVAAVSVDHGKATASMIEGLPADTLKFGLLFKGDDATIDWPASPIQVNGKQTILPTGEGAGAIIAISAGPCLFTEIHCASMVNYARQPDGSLKLLVTPSAISFDTDRKERFPFLVSMTGYCTARGKK